MEKNRMDKDLGYYEQISLNDRDYPIRLNISKFPRERGVDFPAHWHEYVELHYFLAGDMILELDGEKIKAVPGDLIVVNSNVLHQGYPDDGKVEVIVLIFSMEELSRELAKMNIVFQTVIHGDLEIDQMMRQIYQEEKRKEIGWQIHCKALLLQTIVYLTRNYVKEILSGKDSTKRAKMLERLNGVMIYIEEHYNEPIRTKELADLVHLSTDRFHHMFRECVFMSPLQYINNVRLHKAMNLLKQDAFTVTEIAEKAGFPDYNHFGRMFRKQFGCTPREFRQRNKGESND